LKKLIAFTAFILFTTCAYSQAVDEKISGFSVSLDQMIFTIWNSGYTDKASFRLDVTTVGFVHEVRLVRIRKDNGKMVPQPMEIVFTQEELNGKLDLRSPIKILNPFSVYSFN